MGSLDDPGKFISGNEKAKLFIATASIIGGILIDLQIKVETTSNDTLRDEITFSMLRIETISDTLKIYTSLSIATASFFIVQSFLLSLTMGIIITNRIE